MTTLAAHFGCKLFKIEAGDMGYCYPTSRAAFDAAVNALKDLI